MAKTLLDRFNSGFVANPVTDCWEWTKSLTHNRYGRISYKNRNIRAHRLSWVIFRGNIPDNLYVLHTCDNPPCVNPYHLFLGTSKDNAIDRDGKGRNSGRIPTFYEKIMINYSYRIGQTVGYIAKKLELNNGTVWNIIHRYNKEHTHEHPPVREAGGKAHGDFTLSL